MDSPMDSIMIYGEPVAAAHLLKVEQKMAGREPLEGFASVETDSWRGRAAIHGLDVLGLLLMINQRLLMSDK